MDHALEKIVVLNRKIETMRGGSLLSGSSALYSLVGDHSFTNILVTTPLDNRLSIGDALLSGDKLIGIVTNISGTTTITITIDRMVPKLNDNTLLANVYASLNSFDEVDSSSFINGEKYTILINSTNHNAHVYKIKSLTTMMPINNGLISLVKNGLTHAEYYTDHATGDRYLIYDPTGNYGLFVYDNE